MGRVLPRLHWQDVERILFKLGYELKRTKGSHKIYVKSGKLRHVTLPAHRELKPGTLHQIVEFQMELTPQQFLDLLYKRKH